jgi:hypothetical protein
LLLSIPHDVLSYADGCDHFESGCCVRGSFQRFGRLRATFKVEPVVDVMDAVAVELKAIEYHKKNAS